MDVEKSKAGSPAWRGPMSRRAFWIWTTLLGILFSIGACGVIVIRNVQDRVQLGWVINNAKQVVNSVIAYKSEHGSVWPETLEDAFAADEFVEEGNGEWARRLWMQAIPGGERKKWLYFKPSLNKPPDNAVLIVSPVFEGRDRLLQGRRMVGFVNGSIIVLNSTDEVTLPDGRTVRLSDVR